MSPVPTPNREEATFFAGPVNASHECARRRTEHRTGTKWHIRGGDQCLQRLGLPEGEEPIVDSGVDHRHHRHPDGGVDLVGIADTQLIGEGGGELRVELLPASRPSASAPGLRPLRTPIRPVPARAWLLPAPMRRARRPPWPRSVRDPSPAVPSVVTKVFRSRETPPVHRRSSWPTWAVATATHGRLQSIVGGRGLRFAGKGLGKCQESAREGRLTLEYQLEVAVPRVQAAGAS